MRFAHLRASFVRTVAFANYDWSEHWKNVVKEFAYVSHYSSNTVNDMLDWELSFLSEIGNEVAQIIKKENRNTSSTAD